ncbi:MAG: penicillin-binding protein 2 [Rhodospirillales bacterium]|nr:MAG: penicillin-binding protein 2 [Rhodospirillales bacterium]
MARERSRAAILGRRAALLAGGKFVILSALGLRLYSLQVLEAQRYRDMAEDNRANLRLLEPTRGYVVDRYGAPLAVNVQSYRLEIVPEQAQDFAATLDAVARVIEILPEEREKIMEAARKSRRVFLPVTVKENLTWEQVSRIEVNAPDLPGVDIKSHATRFYPYGHATAHVIGYVGAVNEDDLADDPDPLLELPSTRIGKLGIERQYELALRGRAGRKEIEVNAFGREIQEFKERRIEAEPGHDIVTTIDLGLQRFIIERLADQHAAAVVVMDAQNGDVLALVSTPTYDANLFPNGISPTDWAAIRDNPYKPQTNKAVAGQYAPGSTFKLAVILAALEEGFGAGHTTHCRGFIQFGDRKFHCWKRWGHGPVNMTASIRESCDIFYYEVAQKLGIDKIAETGRRLGLGARTGIDMGGEYPGVMPDSAWKQAITGDYWRPGDTLVAGIGQGYVLATPLQLAVMTSRIATGRAVTPHLTRDLFEGESVRARPEVDFQPLGLKDNSLLLVRTAMNQVVNHEKGTARGSRLRDSAWAMAGKTGTSQVRRISEAERRSRVLKNEELEWLMRDHAVFVGYAPYETPRYAVAVVVEHGGSGSKAAAPVARDIMLELERREQQFASGEWPAQIAFSESRDLR